MVCFFVCLSGWFFVFVFFSCKEDLKIFFINSNVKIFVGRETKCSFSVCC